MRLIIILAILLSSCSVKKNIVKSEKKIETKIESVKIVTDSITYNADTYEMVIEQGDSIRPMVAVINGVESSFSNVRSVTIRKKKESFKQAKNERLEENIVVVREEKELVRKVERNSYSWVFIIAFLVWVIIMLRLIKKGGS
jgi:hypothetical protein